VGLHGRNVSHLIPHGNGASHTETVPAVQKLFGRNGKAFIDACHEAELLVAGTVNGLEGFPTIQKFWPDLETMACLNADGEPAITDDGMLLMCTNNPDWAAWEFEFGKQAIDLKQRSLRRPPQIRRPPCVPLPVQRAGEDHPFDVVFEGDGLVCAFPVMQEAKSLLIVHLVNYDVDHEADTIHVKKELSVTIPRPAFLNGTVQGRICIPEREDARLSVDTSGDVVSFSLPLLGHTASVVISAK